MKQAEQGWMRADEAAAYMAVSRRCLSDWQKRRLVPFVKAGRKIVLFKRADLDKALDRLTVETISTRRAVVRPQAGRVAL